MIPNQEPEDNFDQMMKLATMSLVFMTLFVLVVIIYILIKIQ